MSRKCSYSHLIIFKFYNGIQLILIYQLGKKKSTLMNKLHKSRNFVLITDSKAPIIKTKG